MNGVIPALSALTALALTARVTGSRSAHFYSWTADDEDSAGVTLHFSSPLVGTIGDLRSQLVANPDIGIIFGRPLRADGKPPKNWGLAPSPEKAAYIGGLKMFPLINRATRKAFFAHAPLPGTTAEVFIGSTLPNNSGRTVRPAGEPSRGQIDYVEAVVGAFMDLTRRIPLPGFAKVLNNLDIIFTAPNLDRFFPGKGSGVKGQVAGVYHAGPVNMSFGRDQFGNPIWSDWLAGTGSPAIMLNLATCQDKFGCKLSDIAAGVSTLLHECGHRYWQTVVTPKTRSRYEKYYKTLKAPPPRVGMTVEVGGDRPLAAAIAFERTFSDEFTRAGLRRKQWPHQAWKQRWPKEAADYCMKVLAVRPGRGGGRVILQLYKGSKPVASPMSIPRKYWNRVMLPMPSYYAAELCLSRGLYAKERATEQHFCEMLWPYLTGTAAPAVRLRGGVAMAGKLTEEFGRVVAGAANKPAFVVRSPGQGLRVLRHPDIVANYRKSLRWKPKHRTAILLPCAATKPFPSAPSHKHGYLPALAKRKADLFVVSEPLGIVPYSWSERYPNADYDFPPVHLKGEGRKLLVERFREWFGKVGKKYSVIELALPGHHMSLVRAAAKDLNLNLKDRSITVCRDEGSCGPGVHRATSHDYRKFLSEGDEKKK